MIICWVGATSDRMLLMESHTTAGVDMRLVGLSNTSRDKLGLCVWMLSTHCFLRWLSSTHKTMDIGFRDITSITVLVVMNAVS
jgi:hypothetical protein